MTIKQAREKIKERIKYTEEKIRIQNKTIQELYEERKEEIADKYIIELHKLNGRLEGLLTAKEIIN